MEGFCKKSKKSLLHHRPAIAALPQVVVQLRRPPLRRQVERLATATPERAVGMVHHFAVVTDRVSTRAITGSGSQQDGMGFAVLQDSRQRRCLAARLTVIEHALLSRQHSWSICKQAAARWNPPTQYAGHKNNDLCARRRCRRTSKARLKATRCPSTCRSSTAASDSSSTAGRSDCAAPPAAAVAALAANALAGRRPAFAQVCWP